MKVFTTMFALLLFYSCHTSINTEEEKKSNTHISHDFDTLSRLINLTNYKPKIVSWTIKKAGIANERSPGPTDLNLQAILTFDDTTINRLKSNYKLLSISYNPRHVNHFKFDWLPKDYTLINDTSLDVTCLPDFFIKGQYFNGSFITNNNDVLLNFITQ